MKTHHTTGPWQIFADDGTPFVYGSHSIITPMGFGETPDAPYRTELIALPYSCGDGSHEANAFLIAAAPDLLAACESIVSERDSAALADDPAYLMIDRAISKARAAIAKAKATTPSV